jgi:hypothetical protein
VCSVLRCPKSVSFTHGLKKGAPHKNNTFFASHAAL